MGPITNPPPIVRPYRNTATISSQPTVYQRPPEPAPQFQGPVITVFVGMPKFTYGILIKVYHYICI